MFDVRFGFKCASAFTDRYIKKKNKHMIQNTEQPYGSTYKIDCQRYKRHLKTEN